MLCFALASIGRQYSKILSVSSCWYQFWVHGVLVQVRRGMTSPDNEWQVEKKFYWSKV
jgi:hypothetical protein